MVHAAAARLPALCFLLIWCICNVNSRAYPQPPPPYGDQEMESDDTRKVLGSSVVTSVSVIMDLGNGNQAVYADATGRPVPKPIKGSELASPPHLMSPDRYEFYTFNDAGDLVKRLMTLDEIQGLIAGESVEIGSDLPGIDADELVHADERPPAFFFLPRPVDQSQDWTPPAVDNVVAKVQNVLAAMRNSTTFEIDSHEPSWSILPIKTHNPALQGMIPTERIPMITHSQLYQVTTKRPSTPDDDNKIRLPLIPATPPSTTIKPATQQFTTPITLSNTVRPSQILSTFIPLLSDLHNEITSKRPEISTPAAATTTVKITARPSTSRPRPVTIIPVTKFPANKIKTTTTTPTPETKQPSSVKITETPAAEITQSFTTRVPVVTQAPTTRAPEITTTRAPQSTQAATTPRAPQSTQAATTPRAPQSTQAATTPRAPEVTQPSIAKTSTAKITPAERITPAPTTEKTSNPSTVFVKVTSQSPVTMTQSTTVRPADIVPDNLLSIYQISNALLDTNAQSKPQIATFTTTEKITSQATSDKITSQVVNNEPEYTKLPPIRTPVTTRLPVTSQATTSRPTTPQITSIKPIITQSTTGKPSFSTSTPVASQFTTSRPIISQQVTTEKVTPPVLTEKPGFITLSPVAPQVTTTLTSQQVTTEKVTPLILTEKPVFITLSPVNPQVTTTVISPVTGEKIPPQNVKPVTTKLPPSSPQVTTNRPSQSTVALEVITTKPIASKPIKTETNQVTPSAPILSDNLVSETLLTKIPASMLKFNNTNTLSTVPLLAKPFSPVTQPSILADKFDASVSSSESVESEESSTPMILISTSSSRPVQKPAFTAPVKRPDFTMELTTDRDPAIKTSTVASFGSSTVTNPNKLKLPATFTSPFYTSSYSTSVNKKPEFTTEAYIELSHTNKRPDFTTESYNELSNSDETTFVPIDKLTNKRPTSEPVQPAGNEPSLNFLLKPGTSGYDDSDYSSSVEYSTEDEPTSKTSEIELTSEYTPTKITEERIPDNTNKSPILSMIKPTQQIVSDPTDLFDLLSEITGDISSEEIERFETTVYPENPIDAAVPFISHIKESDSDNKTVMTLPVSSEQDSETSASDSIEKITTNIPQKLTSTQKPISTKKPESSEESSESFEKISTKSPSQVSTPKPEVATKPAAHTTQKITEPQKLQEISTHATSPADKVTINTPVYLHEAINEELLNKSPTKFPVYIPASVPTPRPVVQTVTNVQKIQESSNTQATTKYPVYVPPVKLTETRIKPQATPQNADILQEISTQANQVTTDLTTQKINPEYEKPLLVSPDINAISGLLDMITGNNDHVYIGDYVTHSPAAMSQVSPRVPSTTLRFDDNDSTEKYQKVTTLEPADAKKKVTFKPMFEESFEEGMEKITTFEPQVTTVLPEELSFADLIEHVDSLESMNAMKPHLVEITQSHVVKKPSAPALDDESTESLELLSNTEFSVKPTIMSHTSTIKIQTAPAAETSTQSAAISQTKPVVIIQQTEKTTQKVTEITKNPVAPTEATTGKITQKPVLTTSTPQQIKITIPQNSATKPIRISPTVSPTVKPLFNSIVNNTVVNSPVNSAATKAPEVIKITVAQNSVSKPTKQSPTEATNNKISNNATDASFIKVSTSSTNTPVRSTTPTTPVINERPIENSVDPNSGGEEEFPDLEVSWQEPQEVIWTLLPNSTTPKPNKPANYTTKPGNKPIENLNIILTNKNNASKIEEVIIDKILSSFSGNEIKTDVSQNTTKKFSTTKIPATSNDATTVRSVTVPVKETTTSPTPLPSPASIATTTYKKPTYGDKDSSFTKLVPDFETTGEGMELVSTSNAEYEKLSTIPANDNMFHVPIPQHQIYPEVVLQSAPSNNLGLEATTVALDEDIRRFIDLNNDVAIRMFKHVTSEIDKRRSVVVSPFGATSLLAMVFLGAKGQTSAQMNDFLPLDDMITFNPHLVMRNITDSVIMSPDLKAAALVRQLYSQKSKGRLLDFYKARASAFYDGIAQEVEFDEVSEVVRQRTNELVRTQTSEKVPNFLSNTATLRLRAPLAALSANVFQMDCQYASSEGRNAEMQFSGERPGTSHSLPSSVWSGQFLVGYDTGLDATAVELPHSSSPGGALTSTVFVMPGRPGLKSGGTPLLARLEARLISRRAWSGLLRNLVRPKSMIEVQVPRFEHRSVLNLTVPLKRMGLRDLFTEGRADLKGINGIQDLYLTDIVQVNAFSACSDPNAEGHVETYPTSRRTGRVGGRVGGAEDEDDLPDWRKVAYRLPLALRPRQARVPEMPRLRLDRPFLYFVRHNPTGIILHMGRFNPRFTS